MGAQYRTPASRERTPASRTGCGVAAAPTYADPAPTQPVSARARETPHDPSGRFFAIPGRRGSRSGVAPRLRDEVQMAVAAAGVGADVADLERLHRQLAGRALELGLLAGVAAALPRDERAAVAQQRRRELGQRRQAADGARGDGVVGLAALAGGQRLGALGEHARVGDARGVGGAAHEVALARDRLDQVDARVREGGGEDEAGEAGAGADVGDAPSARELGELEAREAVCHVDTPRALGIAHRARRGRVGGEHLDEARQRSRAGGGRSRSAARSGAPASPEPALTPRRRRAERRPRSDRARRPRCRSRSRRGP